MGLARELSMGPNGGRRRRSPQPGRSVDYSALRRLTDAREPNVEAFRDVLLRVGRQETRMRIAEVTIYTRAVERYAALTGEWLGPRRADRPLPSCEAEGCEHRSVPCWCDSAHCAGHPHTDDDEEL